MAFEQPLSKQFRSVWLDDDLRFKVQARTKAKILMRRTRVAIAASVRTAAIRIEAIAKRNVRTAIFADDGIRIVFEIFSRYLRAQRFDVLRIVDDFFVVDSANRFETASNPQA